MKPQIIAMLNKIRTAFFANAVPTTQPKLIDLLRSAALAKAAHWEAMDALENLATHGRGFTDQAGNAVFEQVEMLAGAGDPLQIDQTHVEDLLNILSKYQRN